VKMKVNNSFKINRKDMKLIVKAVFYYDLSRIIIELVNSFI